MRAATGGPMRRTSGESGLIGKVIIVWVLVVAVLAVVVLDGSSILITKFRLSDAAATAASTAAQTYQDSHDAVKACTAALGTLQQSDPSAGKAKGWCRINTNTGHVTITLHKRAKTFVAWRLGFTAGWTRVVAQEYAGPSQL